MVKDLNSTDKSTANFGTTGDDSIQAAATNSSVQALGGDDTITGTDEMDSLNGGTGNDTISGQGDIDKLLGGQGDDDLDAGTGNNLAAGDYVGQEWQLVDGKWVYNPKLLNIDPNLPTDAAGPGYDDLIVAKDGEDVLLGNLGNDTLYAGAGADRINAGSGDDKSYGQEGDDQLNLERGNDTALGGSGADTVNAGDGDDLVYGDNNNQNLLAEDTPDQPAWQLTSTDSSMDRSQEVSTTDGEPYTINVDLAANLNSDAMGGKVEVMWNGEVVGTVSVTSGGYETHEFQVMGSGDSSSLTFRCLDHAEGEALDIDKSGPIFSYDKEVTLNGEAVSVDAFAPGQANLYQVIKGQLKVFDPVSEIYTDAGAPAAVKVNAVGYNIEDDLLYGIAKSKGTDELGNAIDVPDLVMMDATGKTYRVGDVKQGDFVGDFDDSGNLWTFNYQLNRVTKIDVDKLDENGNPEVTSYPIPKDLFDGKIYDISYCAKEDVFYAVSPPSKNGGNGEIVKLDISDIENGGEPKISTVEITGTLYDDMMQSGMPKGAYGAVFLDGEGNLYFGLNKGDHDLDSSTAAKGAVYQVHADFENNQAYVEYKADAQSTGSNDGAVDPRSPDAFAEVDTETPLFMENITLIQSGGGNDNLRGGVGEDTLFGEGGDDTVFGGADNDYLDGGAGNDKVVGGGGHDNMSGGDGIDTLKGGWGDDLLKGNAGHDRLFGEDGNDTILGGDGNDKMYGGDGSDKMSGDAGNDFIAGHVGNDNLSGGSGTDKLIGGVGSDTLEGGAGNDHLWGGKWTGDGSSDTFVMAQGSGKDMVHDFETDHDIVDLSAYGLNYEDLEALMQDQGWATVIDLSGLDGGQAGDKLVLKSVSADDLDESNFIL